jgi:hypothetical protein
VAGPPDGNRSESVAMLNLNYLKPASIQAAARLYSRLRGKTPPAHPIDHALGIETSRRVARLAQAAGEERDAHALFYGGSQPSIVRKCLELIGIENDFAFFDLGCGKGCEW